MEPGNQPTSLTLLERVKAHDQDAWRKLVHLYGPMVTRWCTHKGVIGQDAEDVQQEVFCVVNNSLENFRRERTGDTFRGWLRGITRHKILDHYRKSGKTPQASGGTDAFLQLQQLPESDLPEDTHEELGALYRRALELVRSEFEERTWTAFWRVAVDGHNPNDIAADLGVTSAAVRKAKSRILHRLREELGDLIA